MAKRFENVPSELVPDVYSQSVSQSGGGREIKAAAPQKEEKKKRKRKRKEKKTKKYVLPQLIITDLVKKAKEKKRKEKKPGTERERKNWGRRNERNGERIKNSGKRSRILKISAFFGHPFWTLETAKV